MDRMTGSTSPDTRSMPESPFGGEVRQRMLPRKNAMLAAHGATGSVPR